MPFGPRCHTFSDTADAAWIKMVGNHSEKKFAIDWFEGCGYRAKKVVMEIEDGKNVLVGPENNRKMLEDGTHPLLGGEASRKGVLSQLKNGTHACQIVKSCEICSKSIKGAANYQRHLNCCRKREFVCQ